MDLTEDLLKLPFTHMDAECLINFLQSSASVQSHEFLLVQHLQHTSCIPALKLTLTLKVSLKSEHDPHSQERSVARNTIVSQYGNILPRI